MNHLNCLKEIQVSYHPERKTFPTIIQSSVSASEAFRKAMSQSNAQLTFQEYFYILLLNRGNQIIGFHELSKGGMSGTIADVRIAFAIALKTVASGMIICHNHPSNTLKPSEADIKLTKKFKAAGELLDIPVLDHIILGTDGYYSFADECQL